jgi:hypothetical protein
METKVLTSISTTRFYDLPSDTILVNMITGKRIVLTCTVFDTVFYNELPCGWGFGDYSYSDIYETYEMGISDIHNYRVSSSEERDEFMSFLKSYGITLNNGFSVSIDSDDKSTERAKNIKLFLVKLTQAVLPFFILWVSYNNNLGYFCTMDVYKRISKQLSRIKTKILLGGNNSIFGRMCEPTTSIPGMMDGLFQYLNELIDRFIFVLRSIRENGLPKNTRELVKCVVYVVNIQTT